MIMNMPTLISGLMDYLFILIFCLIGSIVKDTYNTLTEKDEEVKISRILVSTLVSSIILFSLSDIILSKISWKIFILPCFVGGMVGFEAMGKLTKLAFWINIIKDKKDAINKIIEDEETKKG